MDRTDKTLEQRIIKLEQENALLNERITRALDLLIILHNRQVIVVDYCELHDTMVDEGLAHNLKGKGS